MNKYSSDSNCKNKVLVCFDRGQDVQQIHDEAVCGGNRGAGMRAASRDYEANFLFSVNSMEEHAAPLVFRAFP